MPKSSSKEGEMMYRNVFAGIINDVKCEHKKIATTDDDVTTPLA
jgi:hypothetical protein